MSSINASSFRRLYKTVIRRQPSNDLESGSRKGQQEKVKVEVHYAQDESTLERSFGPLILSLRSVANLYASYNWASQRFSLFECCKMDRSNWIAFSDCVAWEKRNLATFFAWMMLHHCSLEIHRNRGQFGSIHCTSLEVTTIGQWVLSSFNSEDPLKA